MLSCRAQTFLVIGSLLFPSWAWAGPLNGSGGQNIDGGNLSLGAPGPYAKIRVQPNDPTPSQFWTFRLLQNRAIQFPDFFTLIARSKSRARSIILSSTTKEGEWSNPALLKQPSNLHEWYEKFAENLINDFEPVVRGGVTAKIRIVRGGVQNISFYDYTYQIPFERGASVPPPEKIPAADNEVKLKKSIVDAVNQAAKQDVLDSVIPDDIEGIDIKMVFASDPMSANGWWRNDLLGDEPK
jgi:hypothetical protein